MSTSADCSNYNGRGRVYYEAESSTQRNVRCQTECCAGKKQEGARHSWIELKIGLLDDEMGFF